MEITVRGEAKEIAALVLAVQERRLGLDLDAKTMMAKAFHQALSEDREGRLRPGPPLV